MGTIEFGQDVENVLTEITIGYQNRLQFYELSTTISAPIEIRFNDGTQAVFDQMSINPDVVGRLIAECLFQDLERCAIEDDSRLLIRLASGVQLRVDAVRGYSAFEVASKSMEVLYVCESGGRLNVFDSQND